MPTTTGMRTDWALEVVRGREPGRVFDLPGGEVVLGGSPGDPRAIDLSGQEGASPRKMAGRHAALEGSNGLLAVRDLDSPDGTFVNRRRVLPGRAQPLAAGDVIQLGAVQLKVVARTPSPTPALAPIAAPPAPAAPRPAAGPFLFAMADGSACRSWDDFLAVSAQKWAGLRDELTSGRLDAFVARVGRPDLAPRRSGDPDERLDAWLGAIPTTRPGVPELEVHPPRLVIRANPGGGTVRKVVRVSNVGHRLLRSTARVEPPGLAWIALASEAPRGTFATVEETEIPLEIRVPDALPRPMTAELVVEGNGGSKRVAVVLEAKPSPADFPGIEAGAATDDESKDARISALITRQPPAARVATWAMAGLALRLLVGVAGGTLGEDAMTPSGPDAPRLGPVALAMALAAGVVVAGVLASRKKGLGDVLAGSGASALAGVVASAVLVATCRAVEPALGGWAASPIAVALLWAAIGAGLAGLSLGFLKGARP